MNKEDGKIETAQLTSTGPPNVKRSLFAPLADVIVRRTSARLTEPTSTPACTHTQEVRGVPDLEMYVGQRITAFKRPRGDTHRERERERKRC